LSLFNIGITKELYKGSGKLIINGQKLRNEGKKNPDSYFVCCRFLAIAMKELTMIWINFRFCYELKRKLNYDHKIYKNDSNNYKQIPFASC
jgi:hypothetical protein